MHAYICIRMQYAYVQNKLMSMNAFHVQYTHVYLIACMHIINNVTYTHAHAVRLRIFRIECACMHLRVQFAFVYLKLMRMHAFARAVRLRILDCMHAYMRIRNFACSTPTHI